MSKGIILRICTYIYTQHFFSSQVQFKTMGLNYPSCQMIGFIWCHSIQCFVLGLCSNDLIWIHFEYRWKLHFLLNLHKCLYILTELSQHYEKYSFIICDAYFKMISFSMMEEKTSRFASCLIKQSNSLSLGNALA